MRLTVYYHPLAWYCHKVLIALYEHGIDFRRRVIEEAEPYFNQYPFVESIPQRFRRSAA
jgi:glutathione S-transferase